MTLTRDPWSEAADMLDPPFAADPEGFIRDKLGDVLWSTQAEIVRALQIHRKVAVHSCYLAGKSFLAARLVAWWVDQHMPGEAFAVTTAPTGAQVRTILWREIGRAHARGELRGRVLQTEWQIGREQVALGRKPADYDPTSLQGIHARYVMGVIDEAAGVPEALWEAIDSLAGNDDGRILAIGNPDDAMSYFARVCRPGSGWHVIHVDGLETPNFTGEEVPDRLRRLLLSPAWVEDKARTWGEDNPLWTSRVRGLFPDTAKNGVLPLGWVRRCQTEGAFIFDGPADYPTLPVELGVDVGAGGDETVIAERRGPRVRIVATDHSQDQMVVAGKVVIAIRETGATRVKVDEIGIGAGVRDRLRELRRDGVIDADTFGVNVADPSKDPECFNLRSELWWTARRLVQTGNVDLSALDDDVVAQLIGPEWAPTSDGRVRVEPKDRTKARLGRSPDAADAILLALYSPRRRDAFVAGVVHHGGRADLLRRTNRGSTFRDPRGTDPD